jgi:hypothetical protein
MNESKIFWSNLKILIAKKIINFKMPFSASTFTFLRLFVHLIVICLTIKMKNELHLLLNNNFYNLKYWRWKMKTIFFLYFILFFKNIYKWGHWINNEPFNIVLINWTWPQKFIFLFIHSLNREEGRKLSWGLLSFLFYFLLILINNNNNMYLWIRIKKCIF